MLMGGLTKTRTDEEFSSWFANFSTLGLWFSWKPVFSGTAPKAFWFWINDSKFCFIFLHWFDILLIHFYTNTWKSSAYLLKHHHFLYNFISERGKSIGYGLLIISLLEGKEERHLLSRSRVSFPALHTHTKLLCSLYQIHIAWTSLCKRLLVWLPWNPHFILC